MGSEIISIRCRLLVGFSSSVLTAPGVSLLLLLLLLLLWSWSLLLMLLLPLLSVLLLLELLFVDSFLKRMGKGKSDDITLLIIQVVGCNRMSNIKNE